MRRTDGGLAHVDAVHTLEERCLKADQAIPDECNQGGAHAEPPEGWLDTELLERLEEGRLAGRISIRWIGIAAWGLLDREP